MATKLFVRSLAYEVTDETLGELFATIGKVVSAKVIIDRDMNRSKGFGFVEMESENDAQTAIRTLDGKDLAGRSISVSIARPMAERSDRPSFNQRSRY